jgi:hypothetical protein
MSMAIRKLTELMRHRFCDRNGRSSELNRRIYFTVQSHKQIRGNDIGHLPIGLCRMRQTSCVRM